jgi:Eukaryotic aspartyl protease
VSTVQVPITNVYGGGDYTAQIEIGSEKTKANVIMDTGSSTLAVTPKVYDPSADKHVKATGLAQDVIYGTGGWTGPVVKTALSLGSASLESYIALTDEQEPHNFGAADGILGLAYNVLNEAYDLAGYLEGKGIKKGLTYPWPFPVRNSSIAVQQFSTLLKRMPAQDLPPYFTALEEADVEKNIFAFYTLRSVPSARSSEPLSDPRNNGLFILGGGQQATSLYTGSFASVDVVDDAWYNVDLRGVQVAGARKVAVKPLPREYAKTMLSNAIVDSGTNSLVLASEVFNAVAAGLEELDRTFIKKIEAAARDGIATADLQLEAWPDITFTLKGESTETVALTCAPSTYWQVDAPQAGRAMFMISNSPEPQSILGLPLLNNYYTVFDRTQDPYGAIRFASIVPPAGV